MLPEEGASFSAAWPGALAGAVGAVAVGLGTDVYFAVFGEANAIYGTLGALLAIVLSVYLAAIALVYGAHVAAQATLFPTGAAIDRELAKGDSTPLGRLLLDQLRGLFVRARGHEDRVAPTASEEAVVIGAILLGLAGAIGRMLVPDMEWPEWSEVVAVLARTRVGGSLARLPDLHSVDRDRRHRRVRPRRDPRGNLGVILLLPFVGIATRFLGTRGS